MDCLEAGFISSDRLKFWRVFREYPAAHRGGKAGMAARVVMAVLLLTAVFHYYSIGLSMMGPESYLLFVTSFGGPYSLLAYYMLLALPSLPLVFSAATLVHSIAASATFSEFRVRVKVPLIGLAVTGMSLLLIISLQRYSDLDKGLKNIPGVTFRPEPMTIITLTDPPRSLPVKEAFFDLNATPSKLEGVPFSRENERAVGEYVHSRGYLTCLRGTCYNFLADSRLREFDTLGALAVYKEAFARTGDPGQWLLGMIRLFMGPASGGYKNMLYELSDETAVSACGRSALKIGNAYAKFGELEKARYWHGKGVVAGVDTPERYTAPSVPPFHGGSISGRITVDGVPASAIRVGLMTKNAALGLDWKADAKKNRNISPFFDLITVVDGTATDDAGRFSFSCLGEKEYALLLSVKGAPSGGRKIQHSPGFISVSKDRPIADVGTIGLVSK